MTQAAYDRIRERAADRTITLITHRPGSPQHADPIIVLNHGHIIENGTHARTHGSRRRVRCNVDHPRLRPRSCPDLIAPAELPSIGEVRAAQLPDDPEIAKSA